LMGIFFVDITLGNSADRDGELRQPVSVGAPRYDYMTGSHGDSLRRLAISRVSMRLVGHSLLLHRLTELHRAVISSRCKCQPTSHSTALRPYSHQQHRGRRHSSQQRPGTIEAVAGSVQPRGEKAVSEANHAIANMAARHGTVAGA
jgi:hypothetical protein